MFGLHISDTRFRRAKFTCIPGDKKVKGHMEDVEMNACDPEVPLYNHHQFLSAIYILNKQMEIKIESLVINIIMVREQEVS